MDLVRFAKELGYGDISTADNYDVKHMYVGEDGERKSMGYIYVCSELLYNTPYLGAVDAYFEDQYDPFSVTYMVADANLLRKWFVERGFYYFRDEPESIIDERVRLNVKPTGPFKHPIW